MVGHWEALILVLGEASASSMSYHLSQNRASSLQGAQPLEEGQYREVYQEQTGRVTAEVQAWRRSFIKGAKTFLEKQYVLHT